MENFQKRLEQKIKEITQAGKVPRLLLHSCCAPCSSYVLEYLSDYFEITVYYDNPNISPRGEYSQRVEEQKRLIRELPSAHPISFLEGPYDPETFYELARGLEKEPEGGERCRKCYELRLSRAAEAAKAGGFDYFTTTLSISPLKRADWLNELGEKWSELTGVPYLCSDFKKKGGYHRSVELSRQYGLYRQDFCGCVFSRRERLLQKENAQSPLQAEKYEIK